MARPTLLSPSAYFRKQGLQRGLLGGSRGWLIVGGTFWGARVLRRAVTRNERVVARELLKPGQILRVEAIRPPTRANRKTLRAAGQSR